jgi:CRISPR-associated endonuclease/helicase Cas3
MRVLVEQTEASIRGWLDALNLTWDGTADHTNKVGLHVLMGGADGGAWHLHPEQPAVLVGTQDMLLSRALNRGYASPRARWPMEFGLLNQDCLWVLDEIQLMDAGLLTSAQLQAFRLGDQIEGRELRPVVTWWMSATTQRWWLESVDTRPQLLPSLPASTEVRPADRAGPLWEVKRGLTVERGAAEPGKIAELAAEQHEPGSLTLVVVNTVERACAVYDALAKRLAKKCGIQLCLVHSRFRPRERRTWRQAFLRRDAVMPESGRIIVATQVVEAGVDISADLLITDLAPWASVVQRIGRCARYGGSGRVVIFDRGLEEDDDAKAAPYSASALAACARALGELVEVGPATLDRLKERRDLFPYEPLHRLSHRELEELFDTTPDLTGSDLDVSRFIRGGEERDLLVCWVTVAKHDGPPADLRPPRDALCPVAFLAARDWLCGKESKSAKSPRLRPGVRAWTWDYVDDEWRVAARRDLFPGQVVVVEEGVGGYDLQRGFSPASLPLAMKDTVPWVPEEADQRADAAEGREDLSADPPKTIGTHGSEVAQILGGLARSLQLRPDLGRVLELAGTWHDYGKVHPAFQGCIVNAKGGDLAKAPRSDWVPLRQMYTFVAAGRRERRVGFRHELASTLGLFAAMERLNRDHPALLGELGEVLRAASLETAPNDEGPAPDGPLMEELLGLGTAFNLLAYLVCAHHGKVRVTWHSAPGDQGYDVRDERGLPIRGVREGDELATCRILDGRGEPHWVPALTLHLDPAAIGLSPRYGASWSERVGELLRANGPFALSFLEALVRAADVRASRLRSSDSLLIEVSS